MPRAGGGANFTSISPFSLNILLTEVECILGWSRVVGDLIQKGMAGQTLTSTQVLTAIAGRIKEITDVLAAWGVKIAETEYLKWQSVARLC